MKDSTPRCTNHRPRRGKGRELILVVLLFLPEPGRTQTPQQSETLTVSGNPGAVPVIEMHGKSYVDVDALARLTNGSISFKGNRITLTIPALTRNTQAEQPAKTGFSREFLRAVIEEMAVIREWRSAIVNAVGNNYPVSEDWVAGYRRTASSRLALVSDAAMTDSDRTCLPLVKNEFDKMQSLSNKYVELHNNLTYIDPDAAENDPLNQQILSCARDLASLPAGGEFQDIVACH